MNIRPSRLASATNLFMRFARNAPRHLRLGVFGKSHERLLAGFRDVDDVGQAEYCDLVEYFVEGWRAYRRDDRGGAAYPGLPSWSGRKVDEMEGFARIMPLFGAWYYGGRGDEVPLRSGARLSLSDEFRQGLIAGTDPTSPGFWGWMEGTSPQTIVEGADVALALWFFRDAVWSDLSQDQRDMIARWLGQMEQSPGLDKNWHLFYVLTDRILSSLGYPDMIPSSRRRFDRIKDLHLGDGWFKDGPDGPVDYYSAWAFHYTMFWIDLVDPEWDPDFIQDAERRFVASYKYLLGPHGFPIMGRSIIYRMAAPAPLVLGQKNNPDIVSPGMARRALDCTWIHFITKGAVRRGTVTQGYYGMDARLLDPYSGPASGLWSLRSLVAALHFAADDVFWTAESQPLPVELENYEVILEGPQWRVCGDVTTKAIAIEVLVNDADALPQLEPVGWLQHVRSVAYGKALRPKNHRAKYCRRFYRSDVTIGDRAL